MAFLVSFDVSSDPSELKNVLFMLGYQEWKQENDCKFLKGHSTTLYHATKSEVQIRKELEVMCKQLQLDLKNCVFTALKDRTE